MKCRGQASLGKGGRAGCAAHTCAYNPQARSLMLLVRGFSLLSGSSRCSLYVGKTAMLWPVFWALVPSSGQDSLTPWCSCHGEEWLVGTGGEACGALTPRHSLGHPFTEGSIGPSE